jgi:cysteine desulfurase
VEHPAVLQPARRLKAIGHQVVELPVDGFGRLDLNQLREELKGTKNALVSVMWANNETGTIFPIKEVAEIAKEAGAVMHTDAVQIAGKAKIDVQDVPVDMLAISGHKFHAPKGIGMLYVRKGVKFKPFMLGGHQESGRRAGTENMPYIAGFAKACELAMANLEQETKTLASMRDRLQAGILASCPDVRINGDLENRLPNTLNVSFEYIEGEAIAYRLSDLGICISTGSACASGSLDPSHVIRAMGVPFTAVHGSVRFSLSRYNTGAEVDYVLEKLAPVIKDLRELSPFSADFCPETFK